MHFVKLCSVYLCTLSVCKAETEVEGNEVAEKTFVDDIAKGLVAVLGVSLDENKNERIIALKEKLNQINKYVINKDKYAEILLNESKSTNLNETNFYNSLNEQDYYRLVTDNEPKNLYLKLKEKMNRDDVLKILSERSKEGLLKSARKVMGQDLFDRVENDEVVDNIVDKILAETPRDDHKFYENDTYNSRWDPQGELEDLKEYHNHDGRRIYRGERTTIRFYPFMVTIHVMGRFWCGGVLYWHDLVITSASCLQLLHNNRFFRENPKVLQVRIGSNHSRIGGEVVDALEVFFNPGYNPRTLRNNIAVIRLRRVLHFNYHRIPKTIEISHSSHSIPSTAEVMLLGWGVTKASQKLAVEPIFLQRKVLPVYPNLFCKDVYGDKFVTSTMFCAGTFTTGEGACDHDAGGPAILAGRLVGVISFGPTICGYPNTPTVFTLVGAFSDWIETINETMPEYYRGRKRTTTTTSIPLAEYWETPTSTSGVSPFLDNIVAPSFAPEIVEDSTTPAPTPSEETSKAPLRKRKRVKKASHKSGSWSINLKK